MLIKKVIYEMLPKSHNVQLAVVRKSKWLKKLQVALSSIIRKDDELLSDELSDNFEEDGIWNDDSLKETINKISLSAFDIMCQNAKNPTIFNSTHPLTYHKNFDRTQRQKKQLQK